MTYCELSIELKKKNLEEGKDPGDKSMYIPKFYDCISDSNFGNSYLNDEGKVKFIEITIISLILVF